ncbi:MAG: crossover junction endodeoxyribonuclease RuvC [Phycisphaerales bacterium]|nr:crossover junction endodeoxyribonuclease RuvC [Phycisphaerales bacterium]
MGNSTNTSRCHETTRVLGIDPGLQLTGFGCVDHRGTRPIALIDAGVFRFRPRVEVAARLVELERDLDALIASLRPDLACVEALFAHYAHPRTAVTMGHARGVILLVLHRAGIPTIEVPATHAKKALTGNGHASKAQVQHAIQWQLGLPAVPDPPDVADALAIALAGLAMHGTPGGRAVRRTVAPE